MSYKHRETNGTRFGGVYIENLKINRERFFSSRRIVLKRTKLIVDCWMERSSRWTIAIVRPFNRIAVCFQLLDVNRAIVI